MTISNPNIVAAWIHAQLADADIPSIERIYNAVMAAYKTAVESGDKTLLATRHIVGCTLNLSGPQVGRYLCELKNNGRIQSFRVGKDVYYVPRIEIKTSGPTAAESE